MDAIVARMVTTKERRWTPLDEARTEHQDDVKDTAQGTSEAR
ncbi:hypothetical protein VAA_03876 [Vibrio anguillarum 775]|nr:hypothetical protein VAA_03876 [Vibrio anguillarum 775]AGU56585.1 hypothetical protein N175_01750 [Vibrio anguillarum M3]